MEQYRPAEQGGCRLGGTGTTAGRGCKGHAGLQSTGSCRYHGADGGNDGVRLHSGSSGDGSDDCGYPDGTDRMFPQCGGGLQTINWESIVLIAAMLPMSLALEKTGASEYISNSLVSELGTYGPLALMAGIYFTTSLMTMFISNTATAVLLAPIAMQSATQIGVSPVPFLFAVTLGASMCFASPFSTPPNALVMPAGQYTFMDYVKVGLPLQIIMGIVMVLVLPLLFPF